MRAMLKMAVFAAGLAAAPMALAQDGLAPGKGHETLVAVCSSCHEPTVVTGKQMSRPEWAQVVRTMADRGADGSDAQLAEIVDYLFAHYGDGPPATEKAPPPPSAP